MTRGGLHSGLNTYVANDLINEIEITTEIENTNLGIVFSRTPCISYIGVSQVDYIHSKNKAYVNKVI